MSTTLLLIASFFVAFVLMLGGAPMMRRIAQRVRPALVLPEVPVGVGGVVLVLALQLVSFYLLPLPSSAGSLVLAMILVLVFNGSLWFGLPPARALFWRNLLAPVLLAGVTLGLIGLPKALVFDSALVMTGWFGMLLTVAFAATLTLTPLALAALGERFPARTAISSSYLVVPALLGILTLSLHTAYSDHDGIRALDDILHVVLPCLGAIAGVSFYTFRMPWRQATLICMGASGQIICGLIAGWAAIQIAAGSPRPGAAMVSLLWMMLPALFEVAREQFRRRILPGLDTARIDSRLLHWLQQPTPSGFIYASAVIMMIVGLSSFWSPIVRVWAAGVALPFAFAVYVLLAGWYGATRTASMATKSLRIRNG